MDLGDILMGGALGYALSSSDNNEQNEEIRRTSVRKRLMGRDQLAIVINLPINEVGKNFASLFSKNIGYDEKCETLKIIEMQNEGFFETKMVKVFIKPHDMCRVTKLEDNKTILLMKIYHNSGNRCFDDDEIILVINKFKDFIKFS